MRKRKACIDCEAELHDLTHDHLCNFCFVVFCYIVVLFVSLYAVLQGIKHPFIITLQQNELMNQRLLQVMSLCEALPFGKLDNNNNNR